MPPQPPIDMGLFKAARALTETERAARQPAGYVPAPSPALVATPDITPEQLAEQTAAETDRFQEAETKPALQPAMGHARLELDVGKFLGVDPGVATGDKTSFAKVETLNNAHNVDDPTQWTAREALLDMLGAIDRGEMNPSDMIIAYREAPDPADPAVRVGWSNVSGGDRLALLGLASYLQTAVYDLIAED